MSDLWWPLGLVGCALIGYVGIVVYFVRQMIRETQQIEAETAAITRAALERRFHV